MSGFRKFGTSDDQEVDVDREDEQGLSSSSMKRIAALSQEDEDDERAALLKETFDN